MAEKDSIARGERGKQELMGRELVLRNEDVPLWWLLFLFCQVGAGGKAILGWGVLRALR